MVFVGLESAKLRVFNNWNWWF